MNRNPLHARPGLGLVLSLGVLTLSLLAGLVACGTVNDLTAVTPSPTTDNRTPLQINQSPVPTTSPTFDATAFEATVNAVMQTIPTGTPDPNLPPRKTEMDKQRFDVYHKAVLTVVAQNPPPVPIETPPTPLMTYAPPQQAGAGFLRWGCSPPYHQLIIEGNSWIAKETDQVKMVCAGITEPQPGTPAVLVVVLDLHSGAEVSGPDIYPVPGVMQNIKIVDGIGEQLTLQADNGAFYYFDVPTHQWVTPVPSPAPSPGISPQPTPSAGP